MSLIENPEYRAYRRYLKLKLLLGMTSKYGIWQQSDLKYSVSYDEVGTVVGSTYVQPYFPDSLIKPILEITHDPIVWLCLYPYPYPTNTIEIGTSYTIYLQAISHNDGVII